MQNRFGLKDFIIIVLILLVGVSVWIAMSQIERHWKRLDQIEGKATSIERQLGRLESQLQSGAIGVRPGTGSRDNPARERDTSWAKPGIKIQWQEPWDFASDPREQPGFQPGGVYREVFEASMTKVTPYIQTDVYGRRILDLVLAPLGAYDRKTLRLRGVLAEAWQEDPDGMWIRVKILDNARYSNGDPVTAEDCRWTYHDFILNPQIEAQRTRSTVIDQVEGVYVISDKAIEVRFKQALFSNLDTALAFWPLPKKVYEKYSPADINKATGLAVGAGPYKMADINWKPPDALVLERNEQYWGTKPPLERMRFSAINDDKARLVAFTNGDYDVNTPTSPQYKSRVEDAEFLRANRTLNWVNMKSGNSFIAWNCGLRKGKPTPFVDKRVRRAMTLLLNRQKMIDDIWSGVGMVSKGSALPASPASDPDQDPLPYDPVRAKALLKEAGWEDRDGDGVLEDSSGRLFDFEFTFTSGSEISQRIALFVKDSYERAGIRVRLNGIDWAAGDPIRKQRDFDAFTMAWGANAPESDPKQIYHSESIKDQGDNFAQWSNPEADRIIDEARRELDFEKRMKLWHQFERVMAEDQPYTWVRVAPYIRFVKRDIGNVQTYPWGPDPVEFFRGAGPLTPAPAN